ncbi:uncharacterized protein GBIM_05915 [Gryllus bimaculatus]|nr:uncharacterized protein GBIM_05915 [Gryllus bimaculatus]
MIMLVKPEKEKGWTRPPPPAMGPLWPLLLAALGCAAVLANPDAKRLYEDLLSNYNRLIRPVGNNSDRLTVKMGLRLSQLIDVLNVPCGIQNSEMTFTTLDETATLSLLGHQPSLPKENCTPQQIHM